jgi:hypothetical protein
MLPIQAHSERFGAWEVDTPPGYDAGEALLASKALAARDLRIVEYSPDFSVTCEKDVTGPYGPN